MDTIPDDTLELILLHLDSQVSLLRAASTCKRWRRVVAGDAFLHRFGSLHKLPTVAGTYNSSFLRVRPRFVEPSPRNTDVDSVHFSLDFLPDNGITLTRWRINDSHRTLLLLEREHCNKGIRDFIVCEPLTRRHQIIPPPAMASPSYIRGQTFLLGGGSDGMSNFRVLCLVHAGGSSHAFVFCTGASCWRAVNISNHERRYEFIGFASGSIYWHGGDRTVLATDQATAQFSSFLLPHVEGWYPFDAISMLKITVAVGSDGQTRIVLGAGTATLKVLVQAAGGEWALEKSIQLTAAMLDPPLLERRWYFVHGVRGVQSTGTVHIRIHTAGGRRKFSIDLETMEVERLPDMDGAYPTKLPWPPSLHAGNYHA
ncbi:unnamed protein product [Urochloa decumbens]|uniref:F-box domain-containing protein n=1 Tax=Urochloa decumbens TaxID=240449 RepID=A0ABC9G871_9POAL